MKKQLIVALAAAVFSSGCAASGYGLNGSVQEGDRWTAWSEVASAEMQTRRPTLEVTQFREDGVTPAATITLDLAPVLGRSSVAMPKGAVAESIDSATELFKTPVATLLGATALIGQAAGNSTNVSSTGGATSIGAGTSGISTTTNLIEATEEAVK